MGDKAELRDDGYYRFGAHPLVRVCVCVCVCVRARVYVSMTL